MLGRHAAFTEILHVLGVQKTMKTLPGAAGRGTNSIKVGSRLQRWAAGDTYSIYLRVNTNHQSRFTGCRKK